MKKLMFALVAAGAAAVMGEEIASQNTVGYNTKSVEAAKFYIFGPQFEATDGSTDINKIISGVTGVSQDDLGDGFKTAAPHIQVPNGVGYDLYYYLTDGYYATGAVDEFGDDVYEQKPGWCDQNGLIAGEDGADASGVLIPGVAIWIKDPGAAETFQQAGSVPTEEVSISAPVTFALRANSFPVEFNLNDTNAVVFTGLTGVSQDDLGDGFKTAAPHIQVPNGVGYDLYYYLTDGYYATGAVDEFGDDVYEQKPGWCDQNGLIAGEDGADASGIVPAGFGFWTKGVGSTFTITFKK